MSLLNFWIRLAVLAQLWLYETVGSPFLLCQGMSLACNFLCLQGLSFPDSEPVDDPPLSNPSSPAPPTPLVSNLGNCSPELGGSNSSLCFPFSLIFASTELILAMYKSKHCDLSCEERSWSHLSSLVTADMTSNLVYSLAW